MRERRGRCWVWFFLFWRRNVRASKSLPHHETHANPRQRRAHGRALSKPYPFVRELIQQLRGVFAPILITRICSDEHKPLEYKP